MVSFAKRLIEIATSLPGRIAISAGLLLVVGLSIDWDLLLERLGDAAWGWFVLATLLILVSYVVAAIRWHALLHAAALHPTWWQTLRAYAIGAFSNNLLPTSFGGDAVRAWLVARRGAPLARALTSVGADRVTAFTCLIPLAWIGVLAEPDEIPGEFTALLAAATAVIVVGGLLGVVMLRRRGLARLLPDALRPWVTEVARTLRAYVADRRLLVQVATLGLVFQAIVVSAFWALNETLGLPLDLPVLAVLLALILLATLIPISVAGFGVREGAFVTLLAEVGISSSDAVLLSLLTVAAVTISSLPGGLALAIRHERAEIPHGALESG